MLASIYALLESEASEEDDGMLVFWFSSAQSFIGFVWVSKTVSKHVCAVACVLHAYAHPHDMQSRAHTQSSQHTPLADRDGLVRLRHAPLELSSQL